MPVASWLDPNIFHLLHVEELLQELEKFVEDKERKVSEDWDKWLKEGGKQEETKRHPLEPSVEDFFIDEKFFVSELEKNLLNGLAITLNTIFEVHVRLFVREMSKEKISVKYKDRHAYKMDEFIKIMKKSGHPNSKTMDQVLLKRLRVYTDIRNCLVHNEGHVSVNSVVRPFVKKNKDLFVKHHQLWIISVNGLYIRKVISDLRVFFKKVAYTEKGEVIYH